MGLLFAWRVAAGAAAAAEETGPRHFEEELAPILLTAVIDLHSTEYALGRGDRELNPLGLGLGQRAVIKTASVGGIALIIHRLHRTGRTREARIVKYGVIGVQVLTAGWNYHHGRRR